MSGDSSSAVADVLAKISRELWLVTAAHQGQQGGLVATWVTQASLDANPAVFVVSLAANHFTRELVDASESLGLHLISQRQSRLAHQFAAQTGRDVDKFAGVDWVAGTTGTPRLTGVVAWLECQVIARLSTGDRLFYWVKVIDGRLESEEAPLTDDAWISSLSEVERAELGRDRRRDIELQRPLFDAWVKRLPGDLQPGNRDAK
ncbi:MAG: flavin reductase family protein [Pirellulaceae bacterium]|nr:flavin reductase family protein [Pirellulaceae bacterium]